MDFYIMRHGETFWNQKGLIQGATDIELTEQGIGLAEETRDGFEKDGIHFDKIYTSPYVRATKTAEIINEKQSAPIFEDVRIREMCFGKYEGKLIKEVAEYDDNVTYCFSVPSKYQADETGESFADLYARIEDFLENELKPLEADPSCNCVLVVCHGAVIRAILTLIRKMELDEFWTIHQPNCCVNHVVLKDGVFTSVRENIIYYEAEEFLHRGIL